MPIDYLPMMRCMLKKSRQTKDVHQQQGRMQRILSRIFAKEECRQLFRTEYKKRYPKLRAEEIEEIEEMLPHVIFTQSRDPRTDYRILEASIDRTFVWATPTSFPTLRVTRRRINSLKRSCSAPAREMTATRRCKRRRSRSPDICGGLSIRREGAGV